VSIETGTRLVCDNCGKTTKWAEGANSWMVAMAATAAGWTTDHPGWERLLCPKCKAGSSDEGNKR
jgi:hypothetical protein